MPIAPDLYKQVMRHFPSGITVVTLRAGEEIHGLTVSAFCSVSLDPPLVLVCILTDVHSHDLIERGQCFAVNFLSEDDADLSDRFAGRIPEATDRFAGLSTSSAATGAPILDRCIAYLDCSVYAAYDGGDHTIYVGLVEAAGVKSDTPPLVYYQGDYRKLDLK
jgi:flavin reductase (DIM6/NTAB) family NADH-FMN oxidoreductase RutF